MNTVSYYILIPTRIFSIYKRLLPNSNDAMMRNGPTVRRVTGSKYGGNQFSYLGRAVTINTVLVSLQQHSSRYHTHRIVYP